jgi:two-component system response regulator RegA
VHTTDAGRDSELSSECCEQTDGRCLANLTSDMGLPAFDHAPGTSLLLVENVASIRIRLKNHLSAKGFDVVCADSTHHALIAIEQTPFAYAVVEMRIKGSDGLELIRALRQSNRAMRIVVITDVDSFATVILALRAGADDYLPKPLVEHEIIDALLGQTPVFPPVPETPLRIERVCWEHIQRIFEQCGRNVSETARRLGMHRRSLQRVLGKRAPRARGYERCDCTSGMQRERTAASASCGSMPGFLAIR